LWPIERKRAYPEFDHVRTGELGVQIGEQYVGGLRRAWRDGKYQRLEQLIDNVVGGIAAYLVGVKAKREEQEQWNRKWRRQEQLRVLARARAAREEDRLKFLEQLSKTWRDAERLRATLASLRTDEASNSAGELIRFSNWAEERLQRLEAKLQPCSIAAALRDERLFPEVDDLEPSAEDDEFDGSLEQARALCAADSE
jgi:hypothetical protein